MLRRLTRNVSGVFLGSMVLLLMFGVGLWALAQIISLSGRNSTTAPVAGVAGRFRQFATTGS